MRRLLQRQDVYGSLGDVSERLIEGDGWIEEQGGRGTLHAIAHHAQVLGEKTGAAQTWVAPQGGKLESSAPRSPSGGQDAAPSQAEQRARGGEKHRVLPGAPKPRTEQGTLSKDGLGEIHCCDIGAAPNNHGIFLFK